jgi:hypothetical protein
VHDRVHRPRHIFVSQFACKAVRFQSRRGVLNERIKKPDVMSDGEYRKHFAKQKVAQIRGGEINA